MTTNITTHERIGTPVGGSWVTSEKKATSRLRGMKRRRSIPHLLLGAVLVIATAYVLINVVVELGYRGLDPRLRPAHAA